MENKTLRKLVNIALPLGLGSFFLATVINSITPKENQKEVFLDDKKYVITEYDDRIEVLCFRDCYGSTKLVDENKDGLVDYKVISQLGTRPVILKGKFSPHQYDQYIFNKLMKKGEK